MKSANLFEREYGQNQHRHKILSLSIASWRLTFFNIKITSGKGYFIDTINPGGDNLYTADQISTMVEVLIDNIFVKFGGCLFRQVIGIPMGTN